MSAWGCTRSRVGGRNEGTGTLTSPGGFVGMAGADSQTLSFIYEMQVWL